MATVYTPTFTADDLKIRAETEINSLRESLDISRSKISREAIDWADPMQVMVFRRDLIELNRITSALDDIIVLRQNIDWCPRNATVDILIDLLRGLADNPDFADLPVYLDVNGSGIDGYIVSYRGIYTNIALQSIDRVHTMTVKTMLTRMEQMRNSVVFGYKGGEFQTYGITPVWVAKYGDSNGRPVLGFELSEDRDFVVLVTGEPYPD